MDLYEMRKKFREKRLQEQQIEESLPNELNLPNEYDDDEEYDDVEEYDDDEEYDDEDISTPYDKMESQIAIRVKEIIEDKLGVDINEITEYSSFKEDLAADSLDLVELVMELEDEFGISIPEGVAKSIHTVGDAISYIETEICNS